MPDVVMPRLSDSMEEGTILRWLVEDGATVARGDEIAEIETDKANMTYESDAAGVLEIVAAEGDTLPIGELIARIGERVRSGCCPAEDRRAAGGSCSRDEPAGGAAKRSPAPPARSAPPPQPTPLPPLRCPPSASAPRRRPRPGRTGARRRRPSRGGWRGSRAWTWRRLTGPAPAGGS